MSQSVTYCRGQTLNLLASRPAVKSPCQRAKLCTNEKLLHTILLRYRFWVWELRSGSICWGMKKIIHLSMYFALLCSPTLHLLGDCEAQTTTVPQPFSHSVGPDWGKAIWLSDHLYSALSGNGFSDSDLFFCAYALCLHCEDSGKERERERKKNKFDRSPVNYLPGVWLKWL